MKRQILAIPLDEIAIHLEKNTRKDVKIVAPDKLTDELFKILRAKGKDIKPEEILQGNVWRHSKGDEPNYINESSEFINSSLPQYVNGPFAISFANENALQDEHYHRQHLEIYFSEHRIAAKYRVLGQALVRTIILQNGGAIIFGPEVIHLMELQGITIVVEIPAVINDKYTESLEES